MLFLLAALVACVRGLTLFGQSEPVVAGGEGGLSATASIPKSTQENKAAANIVSTTESIAIDIDHRGFSRVHARDGRGPAFRTEDADPTGNSTSSTVANTNATAPGAVRLASAAAAGPHHREEAAEAPQSPVSLLASNRQEVDPSVVTAPADLPPLRVANGKSFHKQVLVHRTRQEDTDRIYEAYVAAKERKTLELDQHFPTSMQALVAQELGVPRGQVNVGPMAGANSAENNRLQEKKRENQLGLAAELAKFYEDARPRVEHVIEEGLAGIVLTVDHMEIASMSTPDEIASMSTPDEIASMSTPDEVKLPTGKVHVAKSDDPGWQDPSAYSRDNKLKVGQGIVGVRQKRSEEWLWFFDDSHVREKVTLANGDIIALPL